MRPTIRATLAESRSIWCSVHLMPCLKAAGRHRRRGRRGHIDAMERAEREQVGFC